MSRSYILDLPFALICAGCEANNNPCEWGGISGHGGQTVNTAGRQIGKTATYSGL